MITVTLETHIGAPLGRCFDLARSVDLHVRSSEGSRERAVDGVITGLLGPDDEVTFEAVHFGIRQQLTTRIVVFERPRHFRDSQVRGTFKRFDHDHFFRSLPTGTVMKDVFAFEAPLGPLGWLFARGFLAGYMRRFLETRAFAIRAAAEGDDWRSYLPAT